MMMSKLLTQLRNEERATTIIEFAVVITIMLAMTFAMIDFGRYAYTHNAVQSAAQEGARAGVVDFAAAQSAVQNHLVALDVDKSNVTVANSMLSSGEIVQVNVTYQFEFITPMLAAMAGGPIEVAGSASMMSAPEE